MLHLPPYQLRFLFLQLCVGDLGQQPQGDVSRNLPADEQLQLTLAGVQIYPQRGKIAVRLPRAALSLP